jgi:nucleoside-triphosphatase THEP1
MDGLVSHFLRQIPLMGALSAEWVIAERIQEGVIDVAVVPAKSIRFRREDGAWMPYQFTGRFGESAFVALNPLTYSYSPMQTLDGRPYGIPPWLSTLKNIEAQLDWLKNLYHIGKKMGLIGFVDVSLELPQQKPSESDAAFQARLSKRLKDYAAAYAANLGQGVAVHYKDQEAKHNAVSPGAAAGAKQIWQLNEEQICSGLDIPPSMMGRSYSTTETYAEVDYDRLSTKLMVALRMIKRFIEKGYELDLALRGIDADVTVTFNQTRGFKEKEKADADGARIDNVIAKRDAGFIDDDEAARELGYEEATGRRADEAPDWMLEAGGRRRFRFDRRMGRYVHLPERIEIRGHNRALWHDKRESLRGARQTSIKTRIGAPGPSFRLGGSIEKQAQNYAEAIGSALAGPEEEALDAARVAIGRDYDGDAEAFAEAVYRSFADGLKAALAGAGADAVSDRYVEGAWRVWRYEDTGFLQAEIRGQRTENRGQKRLGIEINQVDENALRYLRSIDRHYFGKGNYLADHPTVQTKFVNWLQREYVAKGLNIKDEQAQQEFFNDFSRMVKNTSWTKVNQLVETTMARIQNMGQTLKLYETGFVRYRIVGPRSGPICGYCSNMVGRVFEVEKAAARLAGIVEKGFESVDDLPGFITSAYETPEDMKDLSDEDLQAAGFDSPPFHPSCRHRKAAEE